MKIVDIVGGRAPSLSFEIFPPKSTTALSEVKDAARRIAAIGPSFMSVTYGAGGTTADLTVELADAVQNEFHVTSLAHMTCRGSTRESVIRQLGELKRRGIENVLALRGDAPAEGGEAESEFRYASDLAEVISGYGGFCIGGACYPEGHPESPSQREDILNLKKKTDAGCSFLTTQMFFDNNILYNFMYKLREAGISVPVIAGIMPVTNGRQIKRICAISGSVLPQRFIRIVDRYADDPCAMEQAGVAYATEQIVDLFANGVNAVHVYSMNKPQVAAKIAENISEIIKIREE